MSDFRCFCSINITEDIKERLIKTQSELKFLMKNVSWTKPEGHHLTMKFLGEKSIEEIENISLALDGICKNFNKTIIEISDLGFFPNTRNPRIIWIGVSIGSNELILLNSMIEESFSKLKIPKEKKKFHPHLTLGRIRQNNLRDLDYQTFIDRYKNHSYGSMSVERIHLMRSILKHSGAEYHEIKSFYFNKDNNQ
jgi:RNA 2',3'-cyclic 3'-phosphodiesterase